MAPQIQPPKTVHAHWRRDRPLAPQGPAGRLLAVHSPGSVAARGQKIQLCPWAVHAPQGSPMTQPADLHICVATDQNAATLNPALQYQPKEVWILEAPEMHKEDSGRYL